MQTFIVTTDGNESTRDILSQYGSVGKPRFVPEIVILETDHDKQTILSVSGVQAVDEDEEVIEDDVQKDLSSWHLPWISETGKYSNDYQYTRTGKGVNVYVMDTGIRLSHEEFEGRATTLYSFDGNDYLDDSYHGTACASLVGGNQFGPAKQVSIYNVRVKLFASGMIKGFEKIIEHHEKTDANSVVSISLSTRLNFFNTITKTVKDKGICMVASTGNDSEPEPRFPAGNEGVIGVGAVSRYNKIVEFSNLGADIWAPGITLKAADIKSDSSIRYFMGTSASCPLVAGVLAMVLEGSEKLRNGSDVDWAYSSLYEYSKELEFGRGLSSNVENDPFVAPEPKPEPPKEEPPVEKEPQTPKQEPVEKDPVPPKPKKKKDDSDKKKKIIIGVVVAIVIGVAVYFSL